MEFARQKTLIVVILVSSLLADCQGLFASQKMQQITRGMDMEGALSSNEALLLQFKNEKEDLLRNKKNDKTRYLLKNKLKILEGKITFLESQLKHTRPVQKVKTAPSAAPKISKPKKIMKAPIAVKWRPYAKPELRRRIFLAQPVKKVSWLPFAKSSERKESEPAVLPPAVVSVTPPPKMLEIPMQHAAISEARQKEQMLILPKKISWLSYAKSSERKEPAVLPMPQKIEAKVLPKTERPIAIAQKSAKTGRDWMLMPKADKEIYVLSLMGNLSRRDVYLEKSYQFYIDAIDRKLKNDPSLENEYVQRILITSAYESEPESRPDIKKIWK